MEEHKHSGKIYSVNNKLVCAVCHPGHAQGENECYCNCHNAEQERCPNCLRFHIPATEA